MYEIRFADGIVWYEITEEIARQVLHEHPVANDPDADLRNIPAVTVLTGQQGSFAGDVVFVRWLGETCLVERE